MNLIKRIFACILGLFMLVVTDGIFETALNGTSDEPSVATYLIILVMALWVGYCAFGSFGTTQKFSMAAQASTGHIATPPPAGVPAIPETNATQETPIATTTYSVTAPKRPQVVVDAIDHSVGFIGRFVLWAILWFLGLIPIALVSLLFRFWLIPIGLFVAWTAWCIAGQWPSEIEAKEKAEQEIAERRIARILAEELHKLQMPK
jgi:hypothetical protein